LTTAEVITQAKKGDLFVSEEVIYEITQVNSGIYLLDRIWAKDTNIHGPKSVWSRSDMRKRVAAGWFKFVPKAKKATVQILFT